MMQMVNTSVLKERHYLEDLGLDGSITLKYILRGSGMRGCRLDLCDSGWGPLAGFCQNGNEHSGSIKCSEFLD
jgi:hypothetical protein